MIDVDHEIASVEREVGSRTLPAGEARTMIISRVYDTPADDLWDACTNPERISRYHAVMIHREPFARAPPSAHHFIGNQQDAVFVADRAHAWPIIIGGHDDAVRPDHAFHDDRSDLVRPFILNNFFQMRDAFTFA